MVGRNQAADLESATTSNEDGNETTAPERPGSILEPREKEVLDAQSQFQGVKATFFGIYGYATFGDLALVVVSTFAAIVAGALLPTAPVG